MMKLEVPPLKPARSWVRGVLVLVSMSVLMFSGCAGSQWIKRRDEPAIPLVEELNLNSWGAPRPTARTRQLLRRYDLLDGFRDSPEVAVHRLLELSADRPSADLAFSTAEVAFIAGSEAIDDDRSGDALDFFGISVANAYTYLLGEEFDSIRNPYDPQFRQASDLYNAALESALRIVQAEGKLKPGTQHVVKTTGHEYQLQIVCRGPWHDRDVAELKFVSDYDLQGLKNHYRTFGLGVPLIAEHAEGRQEHTAETFYPPGMSFPVTAFLRVVERSRKPVSDEPRVHECILELHDTLSTSDVGVNGRLVPLETDLSIPLAYSLNDPSFKRANLATRGLLNVEDSREDQGLYLLEPYDPDKIPVVMIHGLWSSLITWMEMFNDLRGEPEIRDHYQFWFYLYPTGQPLMLTARQLRTELKEARDVLDPERRNSHLDQTVLVGHSMGGLVARLQTLEGGDTFWKTVSKVSVEQLNASNEVKQDLNQAFFFRPSPSIKRVVTIASPHRGSALSNGATQWFARHLIRLPTMFVSTRDQLLHTNRDVIRDHGMVEIQTSIDSLSPASPILEAMQQADEAPWVEYHNILGVVAETGVLSKVAGRSDGVVTVESARLPSATSELVVEADHVTIHMHPRTVLEVQRILLQHLDQSSRFAMRRLPQHQSTSLR